MHESNLILTLTIFLTFEIYCCCKSFFQIFTILKPFGYILKAVLCDYQIFAKSSAAVPSGSPLSLIHTSPFIRKGKMQCGVSSILHLLWIFPLMLFAWTLCQLWTSCDRELVAPGQPSMEQTNSGLQKCFALNPIMQFIFPWAKSYKYLTIVVLLWRIQLTYPSEVSE